MFKRPSYAFGNLTIDKNNPLTRDLAAAYISKGAKFVNAVNNTDVIAQSGPLNQIQTVTGPGFVGETNQANPSSALDGGNILSAIFNPLDKRFSGLVLHKNPIPSPTLLAQWDENLSPIGQWRLFLLANRLTFSFGDSGNLFISSDTPSGQFSPADPIAVGFSASPTTVTGYLDGAVLQSADITPNVANASLTNIGIGSTWNSFPAKGASSDSIQTQLMLVLLWNRTLSDSEMRIATQAPWSIFRDPSIVYLFKPFNTGTLVSGPSSMSGAGFKSGVLSDSIVSGPSSISSVQFKAGSGSGALVSAVSQVAGTGFKTAVDAGILVSGAPSFTTVGGRLGTANGTLVSGAPSITVLGGLQGSVFGTPFSANSSLSGLGAIGDIATGNLVSGVSTVNGAGERSGVVSANMISATATVSGAGFKTTIAVGSLSSQAAKTTALGFRVGSGTGSLQSQNSTLSGIGGILTALTDIERVQNFVYSQRTQNYIEG